MKKYYFLIIVALILGLVLTGCSLLSNVGQVPTTGQSGISYLTKGVDPPLDLVGLWHLDETSGTTATDSSGTNDGTLMGGTGWTSGKFGNALDFDGINDYVDCGNVLQLDGVSEFTIEFWIKVDSTFPAEWQGIIARGNSSQRAPWVFGNQGNSSLYMQFETVLGGPADCSLITDGLTVGQWNHVAFTWDGTTVRSYIDSTAGPTDTTDDDVLADTGGSLKFGYIPNYEYFEGLIDEVRIWSSALTVDQLDDRAAPTINIDTPTDGATYLIGEVVNAVWSTSDGTGTGVASEIGTVASGSPIDTATAGLKTFTVSAIDYAGNEGSASVTYYVLENFVTGGGKINMSTLDLNGKKAALTFGGTVGVLEGVGIVGQFHIVDHTGLLYEGKGAESWHCNNFDYLEFSGPPAESPEATHDTAIFEGEFVSNRGNTETLRLRIIDNGEPGARVDTFSIWFFDDWFGWTIDGGNFQVHNIED